MGVKWLLIRFLSTMGVLHYAYCYYCYHGEATLIADRPLIFQQIFSISEWVSEEKADEEPRYTELSIIQCI